MTKAELITMIENANFEAVERDTAFSRVERVEAGRFMQTISKAVLLTIFVVGCGKSLPDKPKSFSLEMQRTFCRGKCPVYKLKVNSTGKVEFEGIKFTQTVGKAEGQLSEQKIEELSKEIKKADFFSFKDDYSSQSENCTAYATDGPGAIVSIKFDDTEKTINHSSNCFVSSRYNSENTLKALTNLENKINEIVETKRWVGESK